MSVQHKVHIIDNFAILVFLILPVCKHFTYNCRHILSAISNTRSAAAYAPASQISMVL